MTGDASSASEAVDLALPEPHYADDLVTLHHGDCLDVMREMPDASVDAIVTDPPYGLGFMGQKWDTYANESGRARSAGATFDHIGGNHNPSNAADAARTRRVESVRFGRWCDGWAREAFRVLKPGGHLLAFGGTRTWHRLACAVEDAGFEVRDSIAWLYGSGFPKSLDVSKAIDKTSRREYVLAAVALGLDVPGNSLHDWTMAGHSPGDAWWAKFKEHLSPEDWQRVERAVIGGGTSGTTAGMQNLGPSGIKGGDYDITAPATPEAERWRGWGTALKPAFEPIVVGRKPLAGTVAANVLAHGTGALNIDGCRTAFTSAADEAESKDKNRHADFGTAPGGNEVYGDFSMVERKNYDPPGRWPANVVLDGSQAEELDRQSGTSTSRPAEGVVRHGRSGGIMGAEGALRDGRPEGHADSGGASRFFPTFRYEAKAPTIERPRAGDTAHPTVKPLDLMRWLVRLVTPPGGTVLEPFAGSGTTAEACVIEGFRCIAIEREASYLPLILGRLTKPIQPDLFGGAA